jgi:hypothetical protein
MSTHSGQSTSGQLTGPESELVDLVIKNYRQVQLQNVPFIFRFFTSMNSTFYLSIMQI